MRMCDCVGDTVCRCCNNMYTAQHRRPNVCSWFSVGIGIWNDARLRVPSIFAFFLSLLFCLLCPNEPLVVGALLDVSQTDGVTALKSLTAVVAFFPFFLPVLQHLTLILFHLNWCNEGNLLFECFLLLCTPPPTVRLFSSPFFYCVLFFFHINIYVPEATKTNEEIN